MTMTISEALNQAEALSAGLDWILLPQYEVSSEYTSPEVSIDLDNRVIGDLSENVSTEGENNAEYISFIMDRYHDGVDLSGMLIQIQYELEDGSGSIDGVVNAYMNDEQIKFGWVIPPAAVQTDAVIKIMVFCTGIIGTKTYTIKTLPIEYTVHSTLEIGGSIPEPDENWYLQFVSSMDEKVRTAQSYKEAAAQSASNASDDLADIEKIQADVNDSKSTIQTLAAQVQSNATKAQASEDAANVSEQNAEEWFNKTKEHSGVSYASKELAGIVAPQDVYVNPENGHMSLITQTTDRTLSNSYSGGIKINEIAGKSEQGSTTGKNLLDGSGLAEQTVNGVTFTPVYDRNGLLQYINANGTATRAADYRMKSSKEASFEAGTYRMNGCPEGGGSTSYSFYIDLFKDGTSNTYAVSFDFGSGASFKWEENTSLLSICIRIANGTTVNNLKFYPMIFKYDIEDSAYEPYTGGIPSPNPDYPQEIKSAVLREIKTTTAQLFDSTKAQDNKYQNSSIDSDNFSISKNEYFWITGLIEVKPNTQYTCSHKIGRGVFYSDENTPIKTTIVESNVTTFTTPEGCHFVNLNFGKGIYPFGTAVMLNEGDISLPWQPYQSSFITLSFPITLNGIGDVKDRIVRKDGVWGVERKVNVYKFDSEYKADSFVFLAPSIPNKYVLYYPRQSEQVIVLNASSEPSILCNYFKPLGQQIGDSNDIAGVTYVNNAYRFYLGLDSAINSTEDFANWVNGKNAGGNPLTVMALKKNAVFEPLPTADQIALNSLESFDTVTYLDVDSEVQPSWDVEYGTSRVGGYTLEALNLTRRNEIELSLLKAAQETAIEEEVTA